MNRLVGVVSERLEAVLEPPAVRQGEIGVDLQHRHEHETTARHLRVRKGQPVGAELQFAEQQQVDVDQPG